ncbi:MAG: hypothetical protein Fur0023_15980 [Bacteroidia bacterium]
MKIIKNLVKIVSDIGVDESLSHQEKFRIRFINGLHFLIAIILMIGVTHWIILDKRPFTYIELFCLLLSFVGFGLNKLKMFEASFALFYIYCNFLIVYNAEFYPKEIAGYVYYFPFAMVLGINNISSIRDGWSFGWLFLSFIIFVTVVFFDFSNIFPKSWVVTFSAEEILWVRNFNMFIAGLCVIFFTSFYIWLSDTQMKEIKNLIVREQQLQKQLIQSLEQKEILLAEVHHRVKNNLAILNSIINMNIDNHNGKSIDEILQSLQNRIHNMSMIHNLLYRHENIDSVSVQEFVKKVVDSTLDYHDVRNLHLNEHYDNVGKIKMSAIIPIGIILNEIVTNAFMHAFNEHSNPRMDISVYRDNDEIVINITDNGRNVFNFNADSLGMSLIQSLTEQINGKIVFKSNNGLAIKLSVPKEELLEV